MTEILLIAVGIVVGAMNSIAGGGMLIGFPVLIATGLTPLIANATSSIIVMPGQITSAFGYRKYLRTVPRRYILLLIPCFVGGLLGALLLKSTPSDKFAELIPWLIFMAVVLFAFQPFLHRHLDKHLHGPAKHRRRIQPLLIMGLAMLPISIYGGYFGAGYGFVMIALYGFTRLHDLHKVNGMKNLSVIAVTSACLLVLGPAGLIDWHHGLFMAIGSTIGGYYGAVLTQKISSHSIRIIVTLIGLGGVAYLALQSY